MELNKRAREKRELIVNKEGSIVLSRKPEIQLYLECANLQIKKDDFYTSNEEKIKNIFNIAQLCDESYVAGLSMFLSDCGNKLSPVLLTCSLADRGCRFGQIDLETQNRFKQIYNTPQRIAEAIALENNKFVSLNSSFKKNILRNSLEDMSAYTLQKNKMRNKKIKLKNLINILHPRPVPHNRTFLFKDILEDGPLSKLNEKTLVQIKSDKNLSDEQKIDYYMKNVNTIPINMLIRNLKFIAESSDFTTNIIFQMSLLKRLESLDESSLRYINVFDLIEVAINVPVFEKLMFELIKGYSEKLKENCQMQTDSIDILFDMSGSMDGLGMKNGFKYLVLLSLIFDKVDLYAFTNRLYEDNINGQPIDIKKGNLHRAWKDMNGIFNKIKSGTAVIDSTRRLLQIKPEIRKLAVITDEVSWVEGDDLRFDIDSLQNELINKNLILINPVISNGTIFKSNITAISGLTPNVMYNILFGLDRNMFISFIKNY